MKKLKPLAIAIVVALAPAAFADDMFSVSGFGTVGLAKTNTDDAQYRTSNRQFEGADKSVTAEVDSKIGLQLAFKPSKMFSITGQLLAQQDNEGKFKPDIEWLFAKVEATDTLSIRAGRIGMPVFLISDFRNVGYANPWARPPVDVYAQVPLSTFDGADLLWRVPMGDNTLTLQPYAGSTEFKLAGGADGDAKKILGINSTYEVGSLLLRAGFLQTDLTLSSAGLTALFGGATTLGSAPLNLPGWAAASQALVIKDKKATFAGVGGTWDDGTLVIQGEYTQRRTDSAVTDTNGWYLTGGYRMGDFTPYVSYASIEGNQDNTASSLFLPGAGYPAQVIGTAAALKAGLISQTLVPEQNTISAGVRWNAFKNVALKAQFDRVKTEAGKANWFAAAKPGFAGKSVNVYSLTADFIF